MVARRSCNVKVHGAIPFDPPRGHPKMECGRILVYGVLNPWVLSLEVWIVFCLGNDFLCRSILAGYVTHVMKILTFLDSGQFLRSNFCSYLFRNDLHIQFHLDKYLLTLFTVRPAEIK